MSSFKRGQYRVILVNGSDQVIDVKPTLSAIKTAISADHIDTVTISFGPGRVADLVMMVDDTGRIDGRPWNERASAIARTDIFGDAAVVHDEDFA